MYNDLVNSTIIEFYGHFGAVQDALVIFNGISKQQRMWFVLVPFLKH